ncbi:MAG: sigma 54-interacting transcriptional regulator [Gemmatimonadota bacterium]|nr:sigma 54-interacting transcriptional regulator [Gemmatimonadota bacterium]
MAEKVLIVDDDPIILESVSLTLMNKGHEVLTADSGEKALKILQRDCPQLILLDVNMKGINGFETLEKIKSDFRSSQVIMLTGRKEVSDVVTAIKKGAFDYIVKPFSSSELENAMKRALESLKERQQLQSLMAEDKSVPIAQRIIGDSKELKRIISFIEKVNRSSDTTILIEGETGTGKELIAHLIYYKSDRYDKPFVPIDCGSIPRELLESELYGYERGAFTGASHKGKKGKFESADKGTIFLDEIDKLSLDNQAKLLRFLETRKFSPLGSIREVSVDVRIIAASAFPLDTMVEKDKFLSDLFFRLNVFRIWIPPLRERTDDILPLAREFIKEFNRKFKRDVRTVSQEAESLLLDYHWPGNARELKNIIERAVLLIDKKEIGRNDLAFLSERQAATKNAQSQAPEKPESTSWIKMSELTAFLVQEAMKESKGKISPAARRLGLTRARMSTLVKKHCTPRHQAETTAKYELGVSFNNVTSLENAQKELIGQTLAALKGNISKTARMLKMTRSQLRWKMDYFNLS